MLIFFIEAHVAINNAFQVRRGSTAYICYFQPIFLLEIYEKSNSQSAGLM